MNRRSLARVFSLAATSLALGAALCVPIVQAEPVGSVEHFPIKCEVGPLASGPDGNVWFGCFRERSGSSGRAIVGRITPAGKVSEFGAGIPAGVGIADIVAGPDGNLWVTLNAGLGPVRRGHSSAIGRVTPAGVGALFRAGLRKQSAPGEIIAGPDGNVWFVDGGLRPEIGRITPQGAITEFPTGLKPPLGLGGLAASADGNLWFTQVFDLPHGNGEPGGLIGRLTASGVVTQFGAAPAARGAPVVGPDGNVWFVDESSHVAIDRVTSNGEITQFSSSLLGLPYELVNGPDGNLWFTAQKSINRLTPSGELSQFTDCMNYRQFFSEATSIIAGPDGNLWFGSVTSRQLPSIEEPPTLGRVTPSGEITQFKAGLKSEPRSLLAGPDGRIWFAGGREEIERITPPSAPVNTFIFAPGDAKADGAAELVVEVPDPGTIELHQLALVLPHQRTIRLPSGPVKTTVAATCGPARIQLQLRGHAKATLRRTGRIALKVRATFTPTGGSANTVVATVVLRKRHTRH